MNMGELRGAYHEAICSRVLSCASGAPNIADGDNARSVQLAEMIVARLGYPTCPKPLSGQRAGALFELETRSYLEKAFGLLQHLRPGNWVFTVSNVSEFDQYEHLKRLDEILREHPGLRATLGDYMVKPDILVGRLPVRDQEINREAAVLKGKVATLTPLGAQLEGS